MNLSQIHLALTHIPVVLSLVGLVMLIVSLIRKSPLITRISFFILLIAGLLTLPVFFSGEGAEEAVEHLPGVAESLIEKHEAVAKLSLYVILGTGLIALVGLFRLRVRPLARTVQFLALLFAFVSAALMIQTAHLGGQIRHSEIRTDLAQVSEPDQNNQENNDEEDD